jgi:3-oxoadipate enol-lactonase
MRSGETQINYRLSGKEDGELLVLSNSLGSTLKMWGKVLPLLEGRYRVLRYDTRGHGASSVPTGPYTLDQLGEDLIHLLDRIGVERVTYCGLSLGGQVGMWLGLHAHSRINRLILANTAARIGDAAMWDDRIAMVRKSGLKELAAGTPGRWFTAGYRASHAGEMAEIEAMVASTNPDGYCACCAVLRDTDLRQSISAIALPTLVIAGTNDPATPPEQGREIAESVPHAQYVELDTLHLSAWERPDEFASAVLEFAGQDLSA